MHDVLDSHLLGSQAGFLDSWTQVLPCQTQGCIDVKHTSGSIGERVLTALVSLPVWCRSLVLLFLSCVRKACVDMTCTSRGIGARVSTALVSSRVRLGFLVLSIVLGPCLSIGDWHYRLETFGLSVMAGCQPSNKNVLGLRFSADERQNIMLP